jgi:hypothetical protein
VTDVMFILGGEDTREEVSTESRGWDEKLKFLD